MTPQQLELLVLQTVQRVRRSHQSEDDRVEIKREWPSPEKARQLAGAANKLRGSELIYIVGLDERTGLVHPTGSTEVADWWAQMTSRFDGAYPDLVRHLTVAIDGHDSVTALEFATDRAPYVVIRPGGSHEREVPIREGTRTRSARRDELLAILMPAAMTPGITVLDATCEARLNHVIDASTGDIADEYVDVEGRARCFLEHFGPYGILLPAHRAAGRMSVENVSWSVSPRIQDAGVEPPAANPFGIVATTSGVVATGPGIFDFAYSARLMSSQWGLLESAETVLLEIERGVTAAPRPVYASIPMRAAIGMRPTDAEMRGLPSASWGYRTRAAYVSRPWVPNLS